MSAFLALVFALIRRDLLRSATSGSLWLPVIFFLLVATLYPFAVGPDPAMLTRTGGGMLWVAALLAALLPVDRLFLADKEAGVLDQLAVRGVSDEIVVLAKLVAHWLGFAVPLLIACFPASALLNLSGESLALLLTGLLIGSPALAALAVMVAALTTGLRGAGAIGGLLLLPLAVPILIFGAGMLGSESGAAIKFLAASSLFLTAICPFAAGAALRGARA